ncbi:MAG: hypothetical protein ABSG67_21215 [Thermoguttaceae bacterium]
MFCFQSADELILIGILTVRNASDPSVDANRCQVAELTSSCVRFRSFEFSVRQPADVVEAKDHAQQLRAIVAREHQYAVLADGRRLPAPPPTNTRGT